MAKEIKFNIKLNIDGKNVIVQASQSVKELQRNLMAAKTGSQRLGEALLRFNQVARVYSNISESIGALSGVMNGYISKANSAAEAQTKLTTIMRQRMGATEADTAAVNEAVVAQTKLGIIGGTVQRSGLQQLATFASHRQTLETLLPAMNNLLAQQKGLNATSEDAVGVANLMGKALLGNVGALTRVGITLTDHQKELIRSGDEYTRAATLAQAITDNVGNMNAELAKTDAGQVKKPQSSKERALRLDSCPSRELIYIKSDKKFVELSYSVEQVLWYFGHGAGLGADVGTDLNGKFVSFRDRHSRENCRGERSCEAVASPHCIGNFYLRSRLETLQSRCEDVAAVGATSKHEHLQIVFAQDKIALVFDVESRIAEETADSDEFLVVDLEDVAGTQRFLDNLLGVEILPQIDVENLQAVHWRGGQEVVDGIVRGGVALGQ